MERRNTDRRGGGPDLRSSRRGAAESQPPAGSRVVTGTPGEERFNTQLFISTLIGGIIGVALGIISYTNLYDRIPSIIVFGIIMALFTLGVLGGAAISALKYDVDIGKALLMVIISAAIIFLLAMVFEFIYELNLTPESKEPITKEVSITDYIFCIDDSGSMETNDPDGLRYVALANIVNQLEPSNNVGFMKFADNAFAKCDPAPLDDNQINQINTAKDEQVTFATTTNFEDPLNEAYEMYERLGNSGRNQIVVLLSDGEADLDVDAMAAKYNQAGIIICTIFLGEAVDIPEVLKDLAYKTGGSSVLVQDAGKLVDTFKTIVQETNKPSVEVIQYKRFLWSARAPFDELKTLGMIERIVYFTIFGLLYGLALYLMLGFPLKKQRFISIGEGLLCGILLEAGFAMGLSDTFTRLFTVIMALVFAKCHTTGSVRMNTFDGKISDADHRTGSFDGLGGNNLNNRNDPDSASNFTATGGGRRQPTRGGRPGQSPESGLGRRPGGGSSGTPRRDGSGIGSSRPSTRGGRSDGRNPGRRR